MNVRYRPKRFVLLKGDSYMTRDVWIKKFALLATAIAPLCAYGDEYPARPIRFLVTVPPGGAADFTARLVGQHLGEALGQTIVIDNRPGASGTIATNLAAKSSPDGYTLLQNSTTTHGIGPSLYSKLPYDPIKDFAPIIQFNNIPLIMVVNRDVPARSAKELIALAKAKPNALKFASAGQGSAPHMAGELFKLIAGVDMLHVPYKGSGPAVVDLVSGQVQVMFDGAPSLLAQIKAGRLRALAAASAKRNPLLPDLPTFAELGYKGVEAGLWYGLLAPAKTPRSIIQKLNVKINEILAMPEVRARFAEQGAEVAGGTPEQFGAFMRGEIARWGSVVKKAGIKAE
jgi:tripartite-type tricarboxylate transporter receptor subunit TctC